MISIGWYTLTMFTTATSLLVLTLTRCLKFQLKR